jgi:hypothetical protein
MSRLLHEEGREKTLFKKKEKEKARSIARRWEKTLRQI